MINLPLKSSISWPTYTVTSPQMMDQRDFSFSAILTQQISPTSKQISGVYPLVQHPIFQQMTVERTIHPLLRVLPQELSPCSGNGSQASSEALLPNSHERGTLGPIPEASKSRVALGGKGIINLQGGGRGPLLSAETQSDQNFIATAALFSWLPGFPAAAGTVAAAHSSSYVTADDGYYAHPTGKLSSPIVTRYSRMNINQLSG